MSASLDLTPRKIGARDHTGGVRGFHFHPAAWYAGVAGLCREVSIGIYHVGAGGGSSGEFAIREHDLGDMKSLRLEVFSDAWSALQLFPDLLALLAEYDMRPVSIGAERPRPALTLEELRPLLVGLGLRDLTQEVLPW